MFLATNNQPPLPGCHVPCRYPLPPSHLVAMSLATNTLHLPRCHLPLRHGAVHGTRVEDAVVGGGCQAGDGGGVALGGREWVLTHSRYSRDNRQIQ